MGMTTNDNEMDKDKLDRKSWIKYTIRAQKNRKYLPPYNTVISIHIHNPKLDAGMGQC
jgi:hypothetical protein